MNVSIYFGWADARFFRVSAPLMALRGKFFTPGRQGGGKQQNNQKMKQKEYAGPTGHMARSDGNPTAHSG